MADFGLLDAVQTPIGGTPFLDIIASTLSATIGETRSRVEAAIDAGHVAKEDEVYSLTDLGREVYAKEEARLTAIESDRIRNDPSRRWQQ